MIKPDNPRQGQTIKLISNEKTPYNKGFAIVGRNCKVQW